MESSTVEEKTAAVPEFLSGGGEMGKRIREYDWSATSLGPVDTWPQSLRTCIRIMLTSRQPIWIGWGRELIKFYNDPYKAIAGGKHPWALGRPASVVWKDIWKDIDPMLKTVMEKDQGTYVESQLLIMERNGYPEETYYTFSYTPIPGDDGKTAGMFCANTDDTERIISERQLKTLTQLGKSLTDCQNNEEVIERTIHTLKENPWDFPFALFRKITNNKAVLVNATPLGEAEGLVPKVVDLDDNNAFADTIKEAFLSRKMQMLEGLRTKVGDLPAGAWAVSPDKAIVIPIFLSAAREPFGVLVVGLNPYRLPDEKYLGFFNLVGDQIATSFADVHVLEEERKRSEALAEIDRAKTIFFSNISHEFRTPLTLLLGPIEDALNDPSTIPENKKRMDVAYRNALRMQKLVNTLLDFSRIEAGRVEGRFSKVDICSFTRELASNFRSAIEKAGMQLVFDCEDPKAEVYVDPDMWEKIILNLVSNAFKYSREGSISIRIRELAGQLQVAVSDTGVGIPPDQIDRIFERFHRIENIQGRSQEGTGIGLAMVKELVRLHQGHITVESEPGKGSTFIVTIPTGKDHLPPSKISGSRPSGTASVHADAFVQEALKWLPGDSGEQGQELAAAAGTKAFVQPPATIVIADDNADMRDYVSRLLMSHHHVITAVDGEDAFEKIHRHMPDLLLSDIMMPKLDGFGLLRRVREHPATKNLPVIFLSARAGEEAKVEGLEAGADDYLVKPFSAKELLARVDANIKIARSRRAAENNLRSVIMQSPVATTLLRGPSFVIDIVNEKALEIWGRRYDEVINRPIAMAMPEVEAQGFVTLLGQVYNTGVAFRGNEVPVVLERFGKAETVYLNFIYEPIRNEEDKVYGVLGIGIDVTEQVLARKKIEDSEKELNEMANAMPQLVWVADARGEVVYYNDRVSEFAGARKKPDGSWHWENMVHLDDLKITEAAWRQAVDTGTVYQVEHRLQMKDGSYRWFLSRGLPHRDESGQVVKWFGTATDIHASREQSAVLEEEVRKRTRELNELNISLQQSNNELQQFAHVASHDLKEPLRKVKTFMSRLVQEVDIHQSQRAEYFVSKINAATERMNTMIDGVLNYSMLNASEQRTEQVDLNEVIRSIESDLELVIAEKKAVIRQEPLPVLEGASVLYYQLFYNLINNSLKFSKPDVPPLVDISCSKRNEGGKELVEIRLKDNGIGFEQEFAEKIFETFLRLNSKDQFEGTGLGLALCKRIVERHGGSIVAFGTPGQGAEFQIRLPVKQENKTI